MIRVAAETNGTLLRALVLDFDGVILESNEVKTEAFRDIFARYPEHSEAMMEFHHANAWASRYLKIDYLLRERLGSPDDTVLREELAGEFSRRTLAHLESVPFVGGAEEFLAEFSSRIPLYLASVTPQEDLDTTIRQRGLGGFFRGVYGCPPWTKADAIRDVIRREGGGTNGIALIGDAPGDLQAARETGVEFVARQSGILFEPPLDRVYDDLSAIGESLRPRLP